MFFTHKSCWLVQWCYLLVMLLAPSLHAQDACSLARNPSTRVYVVEYSVYIKTDVQYNTSFAVNTGLTLTVDNAPTNLDLTTTYTSKKSITGSTSRLVIGLTT